MVANLSFEVDLWAHGYRAIAGTDEAGRGAWAGPVVAAAVIFPADVRAVAPLLGHVDDSKRLTPATRRQLLGLIRSRATAVGVGFGSVEEIDRDGILAATMTAMRRAIALVTPPPDFLLVDYLTLPHLACPQRGLVHGDAISLSIAAASIVAKVTRDHWMADQDILYPHYGFARHKGYGTAEHRAALERYGPCILHRQSFRPVQAIGERHE